MKTIYLNGQVYTSDQELQQAFVVEDGLFSFVGSNEEVLACKNDMDVVVDLQGKFVCSGFNDSHMHVLNYGNYLLNGKLDEHTHSLKEMCEYMRSFIQEHNFSEGSWIKGRGWNQDYFSDEKRMPTRFDLDTITTEYPMYLTRVCGHCLVTNTKALEVMGIDLQSCDEDIQKGIFYDDTMEQVYHFVPSPTKDDLKKMIIEACKKLNSYGVTSSQSDDYCMFRSIGFNTVNEAYEEVKNEGNLSVRVYQQANFESLDDLQKFVESGHMTGAGDDFYRIGPLKILGDGSLGARTAYLSIPYASDPTTQGMLCFDAKMMENMIVYAHKMGMQIAVHAIGDACLDVILDAYEKALMLYPRDNHRHGIVHMQISRKDQLERMAKLKLHTYAQTIFLDYDIHIVEECVGKELASTSYSWKSLMNMGLTVSNGTDCPVEMPNALAGMQCAITRTDRKGSVEPYLLEQAFSVKEALDSYTTQSAYASFDEKVKGKIQKGYLADFVVLDKNPFTVEASTIQDIQVLETYVAGKCVYQK